MDPGLSPVMPSLGAPAHAHSYHFIQVCSLSQPPLWARLTFIPWLTIYHFSLDQEPVGARHCVLCYQLPSILNSPRSLTKRGQLWLSSSLPSSPSAPLTTSPCLSLWTGVEGVVSGQQEGTKGEVGLCSLLRGTKLRPLFPLGQRLRGSRQTTRKEL